MKRGLTGTPDAILAAGAPYPDLLLEDFKQQCTNLQGQYTRMHNRLQLITGLNTALLPTLGAVATASSRGEVGRPWLILFPLAGLLLSAVGFVAGSADRKLVTIYRDQLAETARCLLAAKAPSADYRIWLHFGQDPTTVEKELASRRRARSVAEDTPSWWDRMSAWRWEPLSVTRLPAMLSLSFATVWVVILGVLLMSL